MSVDMGPPNFDPKSLPFEASAEAHIYPLAVAGTEVEIGAVSMGNPHAVLTVTSVASAPVDRLGPAIETSPALPETRERGIHGNRRSHAHPAARLRTWRRRNARLRHRRVRGCRGRQTTRPPRFRRWKWSLPGGKLEITWSAPGEHIWMKGPTAVSFTGRVENSEREFRKSQA